MNDATPGVGHNKPPSPLDPLDAIPSDDDVKGWLAAFRRILAERHAPIFARFRELELGAGQVPEIKSDDDAGRVTDFLGQCAEAVADAAKAHKAEKAWFLAAGRIVDETLKHSADTFAGKVGPIRQRVERWVLAEKRRKELERQALLRRAEQERQAAEKRAAEERRKAEELAAKDRAKAAEHLARAEEAENAAEAATARLNAPAAPAQARGEYGTVASLQVTGWGFKIVDLSLVPREYLQVDVAALDEAINKDGVRDIPGVEIFERDPTLRVRRGG